MEAHLVRHVRRRRPLAITPRLEHLLHLARVGRYGVKPSGALGDGAREQRPIDRRRGGRAGASKAEDDQHRRERRADGLPLLRGGGLQLQPPRGRGARRVEQLLHGRAAGARGQG